MWQKIREKSSGRFLVNIAALLVIGYMGFGTLQVISRNYRLQQEVDNLNSQISLLQLQTQDLQYQIAYYQTDAFADKEARDKLALQAPGEHVVIFSNKIPGDAIANPATSQPSVKQAISNLQQWLYFLFRIQPKA